MNRRATQQCNMSPSYVYAVYWLPPASSAFLLLARKCNWLAEKMLITCVMRHARLQKLQRFRRKMPFYSFLILWHYLRFHICLISLGSLSWKTRPIFLAQKSFFSKFKLYYKSIFGPITQKPRKNNHIKARSKNAWAKKVQWFNILWLTIFNYCRI